MALAVTTVGGADAPDTATGAATTTAPVALQDKLARCQRQLGDWEACASSKTPEGKRIIQNLRAQIGNIESRIQAQSANGNNDVTPTAASQARVPSLSTTGSLVNVFA